MADGSISLRGERTDWPRSLWAATAAPAPAISPPNGLAETDVAIVGAGYLGCSAALHLAEAGLRVVVLDAAAPGWGASGRNNGQVIPGLKHDPRAVEAMLGRDSGARLAAWAGRAPDLVFDLIARHGIDCAALRRGWIQPAYSAAALATIETRCADWQARGADVELLRREALPALLGTDAFHGGWIDRRGGSIQPLSYARGLARAALAAGAVIHAPAAVVGLERMGAHWRLAMRNAQVLADKVILATSAYGTLLPELARAVVPVRSAQAATRPLGANMLATILPQRHVASDTRRLLTSFRISPDGRLVMGGNGASGGAEHPALLRHLHRAAQELFGHFGALEWEFGWSGYLAITADHLPHIYEPQDGLLAGIGCNGRGIAVSTALGKLIAERLLGRDARDLEVPVVRMRPFVFHRLRHLGIAAATRWSRLRDARERAASR
ncbi:MAG TPA: FAD-binding oxidoreductase [Alphaproteobacteria bacterium]|nr:FAD-binding oxidoreductase [Alphaproteobacteria bacterium]